jgi:hypothetical protein
MLANPRPRSFIPLQYSRCCFSEFGFLCIKYAARADCDQKHFDKAIKALEEEVGGNHQFHINLHLVSQT